MFTSQELVVHYQQNSLDSEVQTNLMYPYLDVAESRPSNDATPVFATIRRSSTQLQGSECWALVLFDCTATYPDELTVNVCTLIVISQELFILTFFFYYRDMIG